MISLLLVDDELPVRRATARHLRTRGIAVDAYGTPEDFMSAARKRVQDMLLLDWNLVSCEGSTLCRSLRFEGDPRPMVLWSGKMSQAHGREIALRAGANDFIQKGADPNLLADRLVELRDETQVVDADVQLGWWTHGREWLDDAAFQNVAAAVRVGHPQCVARILIAARWIDRNVITECAAVLRSRSREYAVFAGPLEDGRDGEPLRVLRDVGFDEVLSFPVNTTELETRLYAQIRRLSSSEMVSAPVLDGRIFRRGKKTVILTAHQSKLLRAVLDKPGEVVAYLDLIRSVYSVRVDSESMRHRLWQLVSELRPVLRRFDCEMKAVHSCGYMLLVS